MEDSQPLRVTALIVARNCANELRQCLEAIEKSVERERIEVLVIDSGSTDGSADVASEFASANTMRLPKHFGRTKALNIGSRTAKGTHILFLPPHVIVAPETIVKLADKLEASEEIAAVSPYVERVFRLPESGDLAAACTTGELPDAVAVDTSAAEVLVEFPRDAPLLVRRSFIRGMNFFDAKFGEYWADLELCWQLRSSGKRTLVLPPIPVTYLPQHPADRSSLYTTDCIHGASVYLSKHYGFWTGLRFRINAAMKATAGARLQEAGWILSGKKVDGT